MHLTLARLVAVVSVTVCASLVHAAGNTDQEVVKFRLKDWKAVRFDDGKSAETYLEIMKQLGCEATHEKHRWQTDVRYRCTQWRSLALKTHSDAHKWDKWLKSNGFETIHKH